MIYCSLNHEILERYRDSWKTEADSMQRARGDYRNWILLDLVIQEEITVLLEAALLASGV